MSQLAPTTLPALTVNSWQPAAVKLITTAPSAITAYTVEASKAWVKSAKDHIKALEVDRMAITKQLDEAKKAIMEHEKELRKPLEEQLNQVLALQQQYIDDLERERQRIEAEAAAKAKCIADTGRAVQERLDHYTSRIALWATYEQATDGLNILKGWTPKTPKDVDADLFAAKWAEAKPKLVELATQRMFALQAGIEKPVEMPQVIASVGREIMEATAVEVQHVPKGVSITYTPVLDPSCDIIAIARLAQAAGYDVMADVTKWATKIKGTPAIAGVQWVENRKLKNAVR